MNAVCFIKHKCIFRDLIADILQTAHDSKRYGHFELAKAMLKLSNFHCRHVLRDIRNARYSEFYQLLFALSEIQELS
jgi:hypothetical protein